MPLPNILEFIGTNITQRKFQQAQEKLLNYLGVEVPTKADLSNVSADLNAKITPKADKTYVDNALSGFTNGASKFYPTLALAEADIANITVKDKVDIGEVANGGTWYKATTGATSLTKSAYDPLTQSKDYTRDQIARVYNNEIQPINYAQADFKNVGAYVNGVLNTGYTGWRHTDRIHMRKGEKLFLHTLVASSGNAVLTVFANDGTYLLKVNTSSDTSYADYTYTATQSCYVIAQHSSTGTTETYAILNPDGGKRFVEPSDLNDLDIDTSKVYAALHNDSLFDFSQIITTSFVEATSGVFTNNSAYPYAKRSPYIEVEPSTEYEFSFIDIGSLCAEYDENYVFINGTQGRITNKITTTATTKYIVVNVNTDVVDEASYYFRKVGVIGTVSFEDEVKRIAGIAINEDQSIGKTYNDTRFAGKTLLVAGDSITEQGSYATKYWHGHLKDWFEFAEIKNEAKSGSGLIKSSSNAGSPKGMCYRLANWQANYGTPDVILIMGNMNDGTQKRAGDTIDTAAWNWVFGPNDIHKNDFTTVPTIELAEQSAWMALRYLFESIITMYPNVPVGFIISTPRSMTATKSGTPRSSYTTKCWGKTSWFEEWVDMINIITGHYSIPVLDLYHSSNFRPWNATNNNTVFVNDGIHPNTLGHQLMAQKIAEFMKQFV